MQLCNLHDARCHYYLEGQGVVSTLITPISHIVIPVLPSLETSGMVSAH